MTTLIYRCCKTYITVRSTEDAISTFACYFNVFLKYLSVSRRRLLMTVKNTKSRVQSVKSRICHPHIGFFNSSFWECFSLFPMRKLIFFSPDLKSSHIKACYSAPAFCELYSFNSSFLGFVLLCFCCCCLVLFCFLVVVASPLDIPMWFHI